MKNAVVENFHYWTGLVGQAGRSKNGYRHFKLILCCFWAIISPHTKFHQNPMKNAEVENFHFWLVWVGRAGRSKNSRRHFNLILCCFWSIISPNTKCILKRSETPKKSPFQKRELQDHRVERHLRHSSVVESCRIDYGRFCV